jgi:hypothetical protein
MDKKQTVNASIDGKSGITRALMPGHLTNANMWYELYQRTHCSSCSARPAKLKKCTCSLRATATATANASTGSRTRLVTRQSCK